METLATKFWTQATSDTRQGLRPFAEEHKVSKSAFNGLRKKLEEHPRSAEARALHVDQQSHAQHAAEQAKIEKRKAAEDKRIATRERLKEEQWHIIATRMVRVWVARGRSIEKLLGMPCTCVEIIRAYYL